MFARRAVALALLWLSASAGAQPPVQARDLTARDPRAAEDARRQLCCQPIGSDEAALVELLGHADVEIVRAAASVLAAHGRGAAARSALVSRVEPELLLAALPVADETQLLALAAHALPAVRQAALWALEDRGSLSDGLLARALDDDDDLIARALARMVVVERAPFPQAMLPQLTPRAQLRLVEALAEHPRAAAKSWLRQLADRESPPSRLQVLAWSALAPEGVGITEGKSLVDAATTPELASAALGAAARLAPAVADQLVGLVHARVQSGQPLEAMLPLLENVSERGERQLLALARVLPVEQVEHLCDWLAARRHEALDEIIVAALDTAEEPLALHLLRRAGPWLTTPARRERVLSLLVAEDPARQVLAFGALVDGQVFDPAMLRFVTGLDNKGEQQVDRVQRARQLLSLPVGVLPGAALLELLADQNSRVREAAARALADARYPLALESALVALALEARADASVAAAQAITAFGTRGAVEQLWAEAPRDLLAASTERLSVREEPWVTGVLRNAWTNPEAGQDELYWALVVALAGRGAADCVDILVRGVAEMPRRWLRRSREAAVIALAAQHVALLRPGLRGPKPWDAELREEIVGWLARRLDLDTDGLLAEVERDDPDEVVRSVALAGRLRGPAAAEYHQRLRQAVGRPLTEAERELAHEIIGNAQAPLDAREVATMARLVLLAPLADPGSDLLEFADVARSADYPLHRAVVDCLRRDPDFDGVPFDAVAVEAAQSPRHWALSGRRMGHLLVEIAAHPQLRARIGPAVARLVLTAKDLTPTCHGAAHLILAEQAAAGGEHQVASAEYAAARGLLRRALPAMVLRRLLGEASIRDQLLPEAALAARAPLHRAHAALAAGDVPAAQAALTLAHELAEGDAPTQHTIEDLFARTRR